MRAIWLIADDFGLSPGVDDAILDLLRRGRLSGTGCMTSMPEWREEAARLIDVPDDRLIGLHLTLTDQPAAVPASSLARDGRLPSLKALLASPAVYRSRHEAIWTELDTQFDLFTRETGHTPDFIDGHQHVHFLPAIRGWLRAKARQFPATCMVVRGAPSIALAPPGAKRKIAVIAAMAAGFDLAMRSGGISLMTPLAGAYDWTDESAFRTAWLDAAAHMPTGGVFMCHPGRVDAALASRDVLTAPREVEYDALLNDTLHDEIRRRGARIASRTELASGEELP